jgi:hypothetical protein
LEEIAAQFGDHVAVEISAIDVDRVEIEKTPAQQVERIEV